MKRAALLAFLATSLWGQGALTTISDMLYDGSGAGVTGTCTYASATGRFLAASNQIVGEPVAITITGGIFYAKVVPTDTALPPGQYYAVTCSGKRGWKLSGTWLVPTSATPIKLSVVWAASPPSPGILIPPQQLSAVGLATGTYCIGVVTGVVQPALTLCPTGGAGVLFNSATGLFDSAAGLFDAH
jgi:hypothetical protein